jgi:multidrug efflux pump subunit AcrB
VIALGLLVDNAIVVVENTSRFMRLGHRNAQAAIEGTEQIGWAIVSATATTVLAFLPIVLNRSVSGTFIRSMPLTVIYALSASLLISLTLTPFLSSRLLKPVGYERQTLFQRMLRWFIDRRYRQTLAAALRRPKTTIALAILIFAGSLALFPLLGFSLFPKAEKDQLMVDIDTPFGTNLEKTDEAARCVESMLAGRDEVAHYAANVGHGNPRIYYNVFPKSERSTHAQIFVQLGDVSRDELASLIADLRVRFSSYPGAEIKVREFEQGPPVEAPIAIRLISDNLDDLQMLSRRVEQIIASQPGTVNIENPLGSSKTDLHVNINRAKAAMFGVPLVDIDRIVRAGITGLPVSQYRDAEGKEYDIVVRLPIDERPDVEDFDRIRVASVTGAQIPLRQLAEIEFIAGPTEINHYNMERNVTVTADVMSGYSVDRSTRKIIEEMRRIDMPRGIRVSIGGELESREESFTGLLQAIVVALISILAVLVLQFRSYRQPLIVFAAIPLAVVGSLLALLVTRNTFSFSAFVGLTSLVGIVVNNSIILVDYANKLRRGGMELVAALQEAGETRFIPIILTTATTICGLLPLTLGGGELWAPMGWTIIGGLAVSTMLTLIIVPVLYLVSERGQSRKRC